MIRSFAALVAAAALPAALAAQVAPAPPIPAARALVPDTVLAPPGGPRIVLLSAPGDGVAALRLSVPLREGAHEGGAGWLLKDLALERMETLARPVGARVSTSRTPWGIAYAVEGAVADFEYLAYLLREAVARPDVDAPVFQDARRRLEEASARNRETPRGHVTAELRSRIVTGAPPLEGTPGSVSTLDGARVLEVWRRTHQASAMTLVVSAPLIPEVILAATRGMGAPEAAAAPPLDVPPPTEPRPVRPQTLRTWYGEAWHGGTAEDPHGPVVALLAAERLRQGAQGFEATVELWELPDRWALAVVGAAYPRSATAMRRHVSGALSAIRDGLDTASVDAARAEVLRSLLFRARTPSGLVSLVGWAMEPSGDPGAAGRQVEALRRVTPESTRSFLEGFLVRGPVRAEVRP